MTATTARIDWLSWTDHVTSGRGSPEYMALAISEKVWGVTSGVIKMSEKLLPGRQPYQWSVAGRGIRVYFSLNGSCCFELSGEGCEAAHKQKALRAIVAAFKTKITRIDFAVDMECDTAPSEFVAACSRPRDTYSHIVSATGETCYVGSMKSPRYARVYRYAAGHERGHLLRAEHVFRGHDARVFAALWLNVGDEQAARDCGATYGWQHKSWTPTSGEKIKAWRRDRRNSRLETWLTGQVIPAILRAEADGQFTMERLAEILAERLSQTQRRQLVKSIERGRVRDAEK